MQMYSSENYYSHVEKDYVSKNEYSYTHGSNIHTMNPDHSQPKITSGQNHGYGYSHGGYNNHEKKGHDGLVKHYSESGYEEEMKRNGWGGKDDHYANGGNMHYNDKLRRPQTEGMGHGGYGAPQGHYYKEGINHGGYGTGHYKEGANHGGYGAYQGHNGHYKEEGNHGGYGAYHGGYGAPQGHYGPHKEYPETKKVSIWEIKGIVD